MKTIVLASPPRRGADVKTAQKNLTKNVFKQNFQPGEVDGQFGEQTARAAKRAKYWVGYPPSGILPSYGDKLNAYLSGKKKLPAAYLSRRKSRLKLAAAKPLRQKALEKAITQIGKTESPRGSNMNPYGLWYGYNGVPWCAEFCTWCYVGAGAKTSFKKGERWAYVPWIVQAARRGDYSCSITHEPKPGDLVCYDWEGNGVADHVGMFEKWLDDAHSRFSAIEGNTAVGNDSNGGEVMRRERTKSNVQAFVHVGA